MLPELCLALVIASLTAYAMLGGADLGAGLWDLTAGGPHRGARVRGMVQRSMSPVWEANHVWVPFVLVVLWTAFPVFFGSVTSSLYVPLFLAAAGLIFRGTAFALRGQAATVNEARLLGGAFALSSVLVPFCLGAAIGAVASGRVPVGNAVAPPFASWLTPTSATIGALAVCVGAYLAAVYLAADAVRAGLPDLAEAFRIRALGSGVVTGAVALGTLPVLNADAPHLYRGLTTGGGLAWVVLSAVTGVATLALVRTRRYGPARVGAAAAVTCVTVGWVFAQRPYLLPPHQLTLAAAAAGRSTLVALLVSVAVGMVVLIPSLVLLYRLVLRGRLDQQFEPLDQRFRPLTAGDHPDPGTP